MDDRLSDIIDKIQNWLNEEGIQHNFKENSENILTFWFNQLFKMYAIVSNGKLTISTELNFSDNTRIFLANQNYYHELDLSLHQQTPRFVFTYNDATNSHLSGIRIYKDIWSDSLTKTTLFDTIIEVEHTTYIVIIRERQWSMLRN